MQNRCEIVLSGSMRSGEAEGIAINRGCIILMAMVQKSDPEGAIVACKSQKITIFRCSFRR